jgi:hypothetical protein
MVTGEGIHPNTVNSVPTRLQADHPPCTIAATWLTISFITPTAHPKPGKHAIMLVSIESQHPGHRFVIAFPEGSAGIGTPKTNARTETIPSLRAVNINLTVVVP